MNAHQRRRTRRLEKRAFGNHIDYVLHIPILPDGSLDGEAIREQLKAQVAAARRFRDACRQALEVINGEMSQDE